MTIPSTLLKFFIAPTLSFFLCCQVSFAEISQEQRAETYSQLELLASVLTILQENYIEELDPKVSIESAINGLLLSLDPHSSFLSADDLKELQDDTQGTFSGIGIEVTVQDGQLTIISPIEDTPGEKAGLKAKDVIMRIDGVYTREITPEQAIKKLRGAKGTKITISIMRDEWDELHDFEIVRDLISMNSVKSFFLTPGLAYSRITNFQSHTTKDFKQALIKLEKKHPLKGLILDLRNNPGGLLNQAVSIADLFLDEGIVVYTKGRIEEQNQIFQAVDTDSNFEFPIIVLVNEGSASASEIVAGALQDHKRAIIVGTKTFGKGSVQTIIPLANGTGLKMTTAKYYTPSGRSIQEKGVIPNVVVKQLEISNKPGTSASRYLREKDLKNHFKNNSADVNEDSLPENIKQKLEQDTQLNSAYAILKSLNIYSEFGTNSTIE